MKKIIMILLLICGLTLLVANSTKLAYVNVDRLMSEAKDVLEAKRIFDSESEEWKTEIETLQNELQQLASQFEKKKLILSEQGKKDAATTIASREEEYNRKVQEYFGETGLAAVRNAELLSPILDRINSVIEEVSIDDNIDMVLDIASGNVLYAKDHLDITDLVLDKLNKGDFSNTESSDNK